MNRCLLTLSLLCAAPGLSAAAQPAPATPPDFDALSKTYVEDSLALTPVTATMQGFHRHHGVVLDRALDDFSPDGIARSRSFYRTWSRRLGAIDPDTLDAEQRVDRRIMRDQIELALFGLDRLQAYRHDPILYVELVGNAVFAPFQLEYAPKPERFDHIIARLRAVPRLLVQARANLRDAPPVNTRVARDENAGNIDLIDHLLRAEVPAAQAQAYAKAAAPAIAALQAFNGFLERELSKRTRDWRLGADGYERKCALELQTGVPSTELLAAAEADLQAIRSELKSVSAPQTVEQALDEVASQHPTREGFLDEARATLAQATEFVRKTGVVPLPSNANLELIETPLFMRDTYPVGGFNPAPTLEPRLGAFYWVTPLPADWPSEKIESKLREYNAWSLQQLTIHEAMPGHYVQGEYANRVEPSTRRVLRALYANGPYVEGWAVYAQQMMIDQGYLGGDRRARLALLKWSLRGIANTILDIRLHTMGMSDQQALDLMTRDTYQETQEATAKLQRAQISSCQLTYYYSGYKAWQRARDAYLPAHPGEGALARFHRVSLEEGAVPMADLSALLK